MNQYKLEANTWRWCNVQASVNLFLSHFQLDDKVSPVVLVNHVG